MSLPLPSNANNQKIIKELNALGVRVVALEGRVETLKEVCETLDGRLTEVEEKLAGLQPCPDQPLPPVSSPVLSLSSLSIELATTVGDPAPAFSTVVASNSGTGVLDTPTAFVNDPDDIIDNVSIVLAAAQQWDILISFKNKGTPGVYTSTVSVSSANASNGAQVISVELTVSAAAVLTLIALPTSLSFVGIDGGSTPPAQTVALTKGGTGTLNTPTAVVTSDPDAIIASAVITQIGTQVWRLTVTPNLIGAGSYSATIQVSSSNATNAPIDISVSLVVTAASLLNTYRGANLPTGMTSTTDQANGLYSSLSTPFGGTVWDISDLIIGSSRYNAALTLTVSGTGSTGRANLLAHLATVAANDADYKIILPLGILSGGIYTLPAKSFPNRHCWIVAASVHNGTFISRGTKVLPSTTGMTTLEGAAATVHDAIVEFADSGNARGYSFHGCIIQNDQTSAAADIQLGLISFRRTTAQTALGDYPGRLYIDRCWLRGSDLTDVRRGVYANGPYFAIEDSRITGVHCIGNESAGIGAYTGARFHKQINCTIEAGTQAILYGGADPDQPNTNTLDPADIYTERVYAFKPLTWLTTHPSYAGTHWTVKTGFEAKNVRRWLIDRCWTQNCWPDAQTGFCMLFQNLSDNNTNDLENRIEDVIVRNHRFDYSAMGFNFLSRVAFGGGTLPAHRATRFVGDNWLMTRIGGNRGDDPAIILNGLSQALGYSLQLLSDIDGVILDRITSDGERGFNLDGSGALGTITNFVTRLGQYGAFRSGGLVGDAALAALFDAGLTVDGNVGYDLSESTMVTGWDADETNVSMKFQNYAGYDYRLTTDHLTKGIGGSRPGCDIDTLTTVLGGVNT